MIDLHIHSLISHDGKASIRENCLKAREIGLNEIGFSEHLDLFPSDPHFGKHDYEQYREEILNARKEFPDLKIRMGVEATYLPAIRKELQDYLADKEYDYVMGAVHLVKNGELSISEEDGCREFFSKKPAEDCYQEYFELILEAVRSGLFDAIAHLDIINRYGVDYCPDWEWQSCYGLIRRIFEGMIKRGIALEINSAGLRQSPNRTYPGQGLLEFYRELEGEMITLGSDAHKLENFGFGIGQAWNLARVLGFTKVVSFERRIPQWVEIANLKLVSG